jgi:serine/threonine protein kinase
VNKPITIKTVIGQTIGGGLLILEQIGTGGMGSVFKARDLHLDTIVAVKIVRSVTDGVKPMLRLQQESKALAELEHANIVSVKTFGLDPRLGAYLVMEYIDGIDLGSYLKLNGALDEDRFRTIFLPICHALAYIHSHNILHRDIKPSNIMLVSTDDNKIVPKLVDLGLVKKFDVTEQFQKLTSTGAIIGSVNYMSPEQCRADELDARSDLYSLACTMHESISGNVPFASESLIHTIYSHANETLPPLEGDKLAYISLILQRCTAINPDDRLPSVDQMRQYLENRKLPEPLAVAAASKKPPLFTASTLRMSLFAIVFCAVLAATFTWWLSTGHSPFSGKSPIPQLKEVEEAGRKGDYKLMDQGWRQMNTNGHELNQAMETALCDICVQQIQNNANSHKSADFMRILLSHTRKDAPANSNDTAYQPRPDFITSRIGRLLSLGALKESDDIINDELKVSRNYPLSLSVCHRLKAQIYQRQNKPDKVQPEMDTAETLARQAIDGDIDINAQYAHTVLFYNRLANVNLALERKDPHAALALIQGWLAKYEDEERSEKTATMLDEQGKSLLELGDKASVLAAKQSFEKAIPLAQERIKHIDLNARLEIQQVIDDCKQQLMKLKLLDQAAPKPNH